MAHRTSPDDFIVWSDDTYCNRSDLDEYQHMSNDFLVIPVDLMSSDDAFYKQPYNTAIQALFH